MTPEHVKKTVTKIADLLSCCPVAHADECEYKNFPALTSEEECTCGAFHARQAFTLARGLVGFFELDTVTPEATKTESP